MDINCHCNVRIFKFVRTLHLIILQFFTFCLTLFIKLHHITLHLSPLTESFSPSIFLIISPFQSFHPLDHCIISIIHLFIVSIISSFYLFTISGSYEAIQKVRIHEALLHLTGGSIQQVNLTQDTKLSEKGRDTYYTFIFDL